MGWWDNVTWHSNRQRLLDAIYRNKDLSGMLGWNKSAEDLQQIRNLINKYGYTETQLIDILNNYYKPDSWWVAGEHDIPTLLLTDLKEMDTWESMIGDAPVMPTADQYYDEAAKQVDDEIAQLNQMYDELFTSQTGLLQNQLNENQNMFMDYRNQVLTNNAMNQQMLAGSTRFELERQQRNAIIRGASAAQRLVANINTQLGMQSKSAQLSLDTSNALAQQLLLHRQANTEVRNAYMNAQASNVSNKANLLNGRTERIMNAQNTRLGQAMDAYDLAKEAYNNRRSSIEGTNPFSSAWTSYYTKKQQSQQNSQNNNSGY